MREAHLCDALTVKTELNLLVLPGLFIRHRFNRVEIQEAISMNFYQWASMQPVFIQVPLGLVIFVGAAVLLILFLRSVGRLLDIEDTINFKVLEGEVALEKEVERNGNAEAIDALRKKVRLNFVLYRVVWPIVVVLILLVVLSVLTAVFV